MELNEIISFCQSDLSSSSFASFEDMRTKNELCDMTIKIRNSTFVAHRVILAAAIPHFRLVLTSRTSESEVKELTMGDMDPAVLESIINFAYTSRIDISTENVQSLLLACETLQIDQVKAACLEFLSERLDAIHVAQVGTFALKHNNTKLIERTSICIRENFEAFSETDDFLNLSPSCVREIISKDDLRVSREEIVFEAVVKWTKFSPSERQNFLPELLSEIRMVHIPVRYLINEVVSEDLIRMSIPCRDLIQKVQNYHLLPKQESSFLKLKIQPRASGYITSDIYAVCESLSLGYCIYHCQLTKGTWNLVNSDKLQLRDYLLGAVAANENIYLILKDTIARFHVKAHEWEILLNSKHTDLDGAAFLSHENMIYCFGSCSPNFRNKVRCFDTQTNIWLKEATMTTFRFHCASASLEDSVYVTGGGKICGSITSVEKYNTVTRLCTVAPAMLRARVNHGCTSLNGKIYVCGGYDGIEQLKTAEVFDPLINKWNFISSNITLRQRCTLISTNNKLFAFRMTSDGKGGKIEIYKEESRKWAETDFSMPSGFKTVVKV